MRLVHYEQNMFDAFWDNSFWYILNPNQKQHTLCTQAAVVAAHKRQRLTRKTNEEKEDGVETLIH